MNRNTRSFIHTNIQHNETNILTIHTLKLDASQTNTNHNIQYTHLILLQSIHPDKRDKLQIHNIHENTQKNVTLSHIRENIYTYAFNLSHYIRDYMED